ncbi:DUF6053 domain-containing protein [Lysobacter enzymogenes]|uniref:DUF6053 domain-containing protein n=1 Tax=Lysobacter enzymogenes TaxID=69 RepID=UPI003CCD20A8
MLLQLRLVGAASCGRRFLWEGGCCGAAALVGGASAPTLSCRTARSYKAGWSKGVGAEAPPTRAGPLESRHLSRSGASESLHQQEPTPTRAGTYKNRLPQEPAPTRTDSHKSRLPQEPTPTRPDSHKSRHPQESTPTSAGALPTTHPIARTVLSVFTTRHVPSTRSTARVLYTATERLK